MKKDIYGKIKEKTGKDCIIIGLTGPTGSGKSTVAALLGNRDKCIVVDADMLSRRVVETGKRCLLELAMEFSPFIITSEGSLNRRKLASIVFNDEEKLKKLQSIIFPYIAEEAKNDFEEAKKAGARAIIFDAPTLFESGMHEMCDTIAVVTAPLEIRIKRIIARDGITYEEAKSRINSQRSDEYYTSRADYVIINNDDMTELRMSVVELQNALGL